MPRHLKMNGNDIGRLSYKELQALAIRYRVPGNIKKKLLVRVLQAAKGGNENEVNRLLQDYKQNRKRKVRKLKNGSVLGLTSTPLDSPDYVMADDYYFPQQQPPYQWVAAEEEIVSRDDESRMPHYEEFKQFLLKRIQREFQTYDTNNNQIQDPSIVDLRTASVSSVLQKDPLDTDDYSRSNIIAVNNAESLVYQPNDHVEYQTLEDTSSNVQGSVLLKKMLQAPVGANLGEIASPVVSGYRVWPMDHYQSNDLLDNSDTLTAESDNEDNEENFESNAECYGLLSRIKGEYLLNEPTFVKNVDEIGQQISSVLTNENVSQYKYSSSNVDMQQDYENWTITNVIDPTEANCASSDVQSSKIFQSMYYDNMGSNPLNKPINEESLTCQYSMAENVHTYNSNQNLLNLNVTEENQYYDTSIIPSGPSVQSDISNTCYLQNLIKYSTETSGEYLQSTRSFSNANQDLYSSTVSQTFSNNSHFNSAPPYVGTYSNQGNVPLPTNLEQQRQNCSTSAQSESNVNKNNSGTLDKVQSSGLLDSFWPTKFSKTPGDPVLENILNMIDAKRVDLAKLDHTSCVYCYIAPIVSHTPVSSSVVCSQKEKFVAEYRQHSFTPHWLLYNDASSGTRMTNLHSELENTPEEAQMPRTSTPNSNADLRESENEDSVAKVWQDYEKDGNICEDLKVEVTDCLFSVIHTEPLVTQANDTSKD
ncbi:uncharacterized protein LOC143216195 [Lasioglossum baleicum]|uniref:uncharacterized protein LOC143216195 n=1 Tax=Lasioglossum baleicum TaxID=434251 RepID=UPI003FCED947